MVSDKPVVADLRRRVVAKHSAPITGDTTPLDDKSVNPAVIGAHNGPVGLL